MVRSKLKYETFDVSDEPKLLRRMAAGDKEALHALVLRHMPLVRATARRYALHVPLEDLEQAGVIGLLEAAKRFDVTRQPNFGAYAKFWVRHHVQSTERENRRLVGPPKTRAARAARQKYGLAVRTLIQTLGRLPMASELAAELGCSLEELHQVDTWRRLPERQINMTGFEDHPVSQREVMLSAEIMLSGSSLEEELEERERMQERAEVIEHIFDVLTPRERDLIEKRYGGDESPSLRELGAREGISGERVRQVLAHAIRKLREEVRRLRIDPLELA